MRYCRVIDTPDRIAYTRMSAVRCPSDKENTTFSDKDLRKHFRM